MIVHLSSGSTLDGGGIALVSRLVSRTIKEYSREHDIPYRILDLGIPHQALPDINISFFSHNKLAFISNLYKYHLMNPKSVFLFTHVNLARSYMLLPKPLVHRFSVYLHGIEIWKPINGLKRKSIQQATQCLTHSNYTFRRAQEHWPDFPHTHVLPLCLESRQVEGEVDRTLLANVGTDFFLIVGRLVGMDRSKGHDELLEAMSKVITEFPEAKLVVAGKGPDLERLKQKSHELKLSDNVIFTGFVSECTLEALYKRCKAFVMPSSKEGFGLVYLEAMKHKKPCIALKDSSAQEIIIDKKTGILIDSQSPQHVAQAIISLLQDNDWTMQLGENGHHLYTKQFTWDLYTKRLRLYLDDLLTA